MAAGLITYDAGGNIIIDTTKNIGVLLARYESVTANASHTIPNLTAYGTPFSFMVPTASFGSTTQFNWPNITFNGNTVSWTFSTKAGATNFQCDIYVGVF